MKKLCAIFSVTLLLTTRGCGIALVLYDAITLIFILIHFVRQLLRIYIIFSQVLVRHIKF